MFDKDLISSRFRLCKIFNFFLLKTSKISSKNNNAVLELKYSLFEIKYQKNSLFDQIKVNIWNKNFNHGQSNFKLLWHHFLKWEPICF